MPSSKEIRNDKEIKQRPWFSCSGMTTKKLGFSHTYNSLLEGNLWVSPAGPSKDASGFNEIQCKCHRQSSLKFLGKEREEGLARGLK